MYALYVCIFIDKDYVLISKIYLADKYVLKLEIAKSFKLIIPILKD